MKVKHAGIVHVTLYNTITECKSKYKNKSWYILLPVWMPFVVVVIPIVGGSCTSAVYQNIKSIFFKHRNKTIYLLLIY